MTEEVKKSEEEIVYVYSPGKGGAVEVVLTGRVAEKQTRSGKLKIEIYEITPADKINGSWKKWVSLTELFQIK